MTPILIMDAADDPKAAVLETYRAAQDGSNHRRLWSERYHMLDGWRGMAALTVLLTHLEILSLGHEAVMFFFVISGYCITAAAESGLRRGMCFPQFMARRVRRIFPPYLLSLAFFTLTRCLKASRGGSNFFVGRTWSDWVQNLTLTQWITLVRHPQGWPTSNPTLFVVAYWSLGYEEQFYLVFGLVMVAAGLVRRQAVLLVLAGASLGFVALRPWLIHGLFFEYWPHFAVGSLLFYRLCRVPRPAVARAIDVGFVVMALTFGALHHAGWADDRGGRALSLELTVVATFAVLLVAVRPLDERFARSLVGRAFMALGLISYSLYLIHQFNLVLVSTVAHRLVGGHAPRPVLLAVEICLHLMLATAFWWCCERPFLNRSLVGRGPKLDPGSGVNAA